RPERAGFRGLRVRRRAARAGARRSSSPRGPRALLLEEREVDPRDPAAGRGRAGLLGVAWLSQPRRPVARGALQRRLRNADAWRDPWIGSWPPSPESTMRPTRCA